MVFVSSLQLFFSLAFSLATVAAMTICGASK